MKLKYKPRLMKLKYKHRPIMYSLLLIMYLFLTGIRSASFQGNVLTIGTGVGILLFYDLRAGKYLESSINSSRTVHLKASKGWVVSC